MIPHRTGWLYQLSEFETTGALGAQTGAGVSAFEMKIRDHASPVSVVLGLPGQDPAVVSGPLHLYRPLSFAGVRRPAGTQVEIDAVFEGDDDAQILAVKLGPSDTQVPALRALMATRPLKPGRAYRVTQTSGATQTRLWANLTCLAPGTRILTRDGTLPVEALRPGDSVFSLDHGMRPVLGIGRRSANGMGPHAPVHIAEGALGNSAELILSPHHRVLREDKTSAKYFGEPEVLVPARNLINGTTIVAKPCAEATYFYVLFDSHQIMLAEGVRVESCFVTDDRSLLGDYAEDLTKIVPGFATNAPPRMECARAISL